MIKRRHFLGLPLIIGTLGYASKLAASEQVDIVEQFKLDFLEATKKDGSAHIPTTLSALGACAGFGCQMMIRQLVDEGEASSEDAFVKVHTEDGDIYYFGDQLNQPLLEGQISVWRIVAKAIGPGNEAALPDLMEMVEFVVGSLGTPQYGTVRVPSNMQPYELPLQSLKRLWLKTQDTLKSRGEDTIFNGWYFATAAQVLMIELENSYDTKTGIQLVMESAIAMSKINPQKIGIATTY